MGTLTSCLHHLEKHPDIQNLLVNRARHLAVSYSKKNVNKKVPQVAKQLHDTFEKDILNMEAQLDKHLASLAQPAPISKPVESKPVEKPKDDYRFTKGKDFSFNGEWEFTANGEKWTAYRNTDSGSNHEWYAKRQGESYPESSSYYSKDELVKAIKSGEFLSEKRHSSARPTPEGGMTVPKIQPVIQASSPSKGAKMKQDKTAPEPKSGSADKFAKMIETPAETGMAAPRPKNLQPAKDTKPEFDGDEAARSFGEWLNEDPATLSHIPEAARKKLKEMDDALLPLVLKIQAKDRGGYPIPFKMRRDYEVRLRERYNYTRRFKGISPDGTTVDYQVPERTMNYDRYEYSDADGMRTYEYSKPERQVSKGDADNLVKFFKEMGYESEAILQKREGHVNGEWYVVRKPPAEPVLDGVPHHETLAPTYAPKPVWKAPERPFTNPEIAKINQFTDMQVREGVEPRVAEANAKAAVLEDRKFAVKIELEVEKAAGEVADVATAARKLGTKKRTDAAKNIKQQKAENATKIADNLERLKVIKGTTDLLNEMGREKEANKYNKERNGIVKTLKKMGVTDHPLMGLYGTVAGVEIDDDGNITYDSKKGIAGLALGSIALKFRNRFKPVNIPRASTPEIEEFLMEQRNNSEYLSQQNKLTAAKARDYFNRHVVDVGWKAKDMLAKTKTPEGERARQRLVASAGANAEASRLNDIHHEKIFKGLSYLEEEALHHYLDAMRIIELTRIKGDKYKHRGGKTGATAQAALVSGDFARLNLMSPEQMTKIEAKAKEYWNAYDELLNMQVEQGTMTPQLKAVLEERKYSPTKHLEYLDKSFEALAGRPLSVADNNIVALRGGSEGYVQMNSKLLLQQVTSHTTDMIFKNNAAKALMDLAITDPTNKVVRLAKVIGRTKQGAPIYQQAGAGEAKISTLINGQKVDMIVPQVFADSWVKSDPQMSKLLTETVSWMSGAKVLKATATGYNPIFFLTNMPRDIALVWSGKQYSRALPLAVGQFAHDFATVAKDVLTNKGRVVDYVQEGGGMDFLTYYGRFKGEGHVGEHLNVLAKILGWTGEKSEVWTRMAHRERAIKNLVDKYKKNNDGAMPSPLEMKVIQEEATVIAREGSIDFSQGGNVIKAMDNGIPYLNASIQGTRRILSNAKSDPIGFTIKMAQLGLLSGYLWSMNSEHEGYSQLSEEDKAQNFVFFLPDLFPGMASYTDDTGQKIYRYIKIAKEQQQMIVSNLFEAAWELEKTGKVPDKKLYKALGQYIPQTPAGSPIIAALVAHLWNVDVYTGKDIYVGQPARSKSAEYYKDTSKPMIAAGEATKGLPLPLQVSPVGTGKAIDKLVTPANPVVRLVSNSIKAYTGELSEEIGNKGFSQWLAESPMVKRLVSQTNPRNEYVNTMKEDETKVSDRTHAENTDFDRLMDKYFRTGSDEDWNAMVLYTQQFDEKVQDKLTQRYKDEEKTVGLPDHQFLSKLLKVTPEVRAKQIYRRLTSIKTDEGKQEFIDTVNSVQGIYTDDTATWMEYYMAGGE